MLLLRARLEKQEVHAGYASSRHRPRDANDLVHQTRGLVAALRPDIQSTVEDGGAGVPAARTRLARADRGSRKAVL